MDASLITNIFQCDKKDPMGGIHSLGGIKAAL